jgi:hypothetical protein
MLTSFDFRGTPGSQSNMARGRLLLPYTCEACCAPTTDARCCHVQQQTQAIMRR